MHILVRILKGDLTTGISTLSGSHGRIRLPHLVPVEQRRGNLVRLEQANLPAQTHPRPEPERTQELLHLLALRRARLGPPLRPKVVRVVAEGGPVPMNNPRQAADGRAGGHELAADDGAPGGHDALHDEAGGGVDAEGLLDAGVEVRELGRDDVPGGDGVAVGEGGVELLLHLGEGGGVLEELEDEDAHGGAAAGCLAAGSMCNGLGGYEHCLGGGDDDHEAEIDDFVARHDAGA